MSLFEIKNDESIYNAYYQGGTIRYINLNDKAYITKVYTSSENLVIPEIVNDLPVAGLLTGSICDNTIRTLTLPKSLEFMGTHAICECYKLHTIRILENVKAIESQAIAHCSSLDTLYMNCNHIKSLPKAMIGKCPSLKSVYFYGNADNIDKETFSNENSKLTIFCPAKHPVIEQLKDSEYKIQPCYTSSLERFLDEECDYPIIDK